MTSIAKKVLIYLFLKSTDLRKEGHRLDLHTLEQIQKFTHEYKELTEPALRELLLAGNVGIATEKETEKCWYFIEFKGRQEAKALILGLTKHLDT